MSAKNSQSEKQKEARLKLNFIRPSAISPYLYCSLCKNLLNDPMRIDCGYF